MPSSVLTPGMWWAFCPVAAAGPLRSAQEASRWPEREQPLPLRSSSLSTCTLSGSGRDCGGRSLCLRWRRRLCRLPSLWISRPCATSSLIAGTGPDGETSETLMTCRCFNHSPVCTRDFFFFFFFYTKDESVLFSIALGYGKAYGFVPIVFISLLFDSGPSLNHCWVWGTSS